MAAHDVEQITLAATGVKKIFLPERGQRLSLSGVPDPELQIAVSPDREIELELLLEFSHYEDWAMTVNGLKLRKLCLICAGELNLAAVAGLFRKISALLI